MVLCTVVWLGFAECDGFVAALACWCGRVILDHGRVGRGGVVRAVGFPGRHRPPVRGCGCLWVPQAGCPVPVGAGRGVLVGWWFENWIVDASIGPPVVGGVGVRTVIRIRGIVFLGFVRIVWGRAVCGASP